MSWREVEWGPLLPVFLFLGCSRAHEIVCGRVVLARVSQFVVQNLEELDVLLMVNTWTPRVNKLEQGVIHLRFIQLIFICGRLSLVLLLILGLLLLIVPFIITHVPLFVDAIAVKLVLDHLKQVSHGELGA